MTMLFLASLLFLLPNLHAISTPASTPHRMFYVASPPYHGNKLLSQLFSTCKKMSSSFENKPKMSGNAVLHAAKKGLTATYNSRRSLFYPPTKAALDALSTGWMYANTNSMFAHTFHDIVLRDFASKNPVTILLLRDHPARALSRLQQHFNRISFFETPMDQQNDPNRYTLYTQHTRLATTLPLNKWKDSSEEELLIGYLIDMESRRQQIRSVAARFRKVQVVDVWYDELINIESVKYLLETRLLIPECNTTLIQNILTQFKIETYQTETLKSNKKQIDRYVEQSRKNSRSSKFIALPSMVLPAGTKSTELTNCILDISRTNNGCVQNVPLLDLSKENKRDGNIFFWNPLQLSVGDQPSFYFGVNTPLPIPNAYGKLRSAMIQTELLQSESLQLIGAARNHSMGKSTQIIGNSRLYTRTQPSARISVLHLTTNCKPLNELENVLCHPIPRILNRTKGYNVRLTVSTFGETWTTMGWFSF